MYLAVVVVVILFILLLDLSNGFTVEDIFVTCTAGGVGVIYNKQQQ